MALVKLHHFSRSSASLRVRIALAVKGIPYVPHSVNLAKAEHLHEEYGRDHPQHLVPVLSCEDGRSLVQSLAIIEYLEELYPDPPLLPADFYGRYYVRAIAQMIACEMHPLNNMRVVKRLRGGLNVDESLLEKEWTFHWLAAGFRSIESFLAREALHGEFCTGDQFTLADLCLFSQAFSARRLGFSIESHALLASVVKRCEALPAIQLALSVSD